MTGDTPSNSLEWSHSTDPDNQPFNRARGPCGMKSIDIRTGRKSYCYQKARERFLRRNPLCAECERQGRVTVTVEMDRIVGPQDSEGVLDDTTSA